MKFLGDWEQAFVVFDGLCFGVFDPFYFGGQ